MSAPSSATTLAIIEDDSDNESLPPTLLRCSPWTHATSSPTTACARLNVRTAHMINCVIAEHILVKAQMPPPTTHAPTCRQGYALRRTFSSPSSYTPPRTHPNTSSARSSMTPQVTCSNIDISSNLTNTERCGNTAS
jgi:hypothetical protein